MLLREAEVGRRRMAAQCPHVSDFCRRGSVAGRGGKALTQTGSESSGVKRSPAATPQTRSRHRALSKSSEEKTRSGTKG